MLPYSSNSVKMDLFEDIYPGKSIYAALLKLCNDGFAQKKGAR